MIGLSAILGLVTGLAGPISNVLNKRQELEIAKLEASSNTHRARIDQEIAEAENRKAVLVAEAGHRIGVFITGLMRVGLAIGPLAIILKLMLWDKVIGSFMGCSGKSASFTDCRVFVTDALDTNQWLVISAIIAFYFGYDIVARLRK